MTGRGRVAIVAGVATLATASALSAVFSGWGWLLPVAGGIAVVVAVSELVRWSPVPSPVGPLAAAAGVLAYVTAWYAGATAYARVIPSEASLRRLDAVARAGFHDIQHLGTPVPTHDGLVLIATVGVAGIALVVDLFAVTMRRAALAGLPLLALFAVCTSVAKTGAGWLPFVLGAAGYLWLLLADSRERLSRWGRPMGAEHVPPRFSLSDEVMPSPLSVLGRRIGLSAIAIAVVVPLVIPGLRGGVPHSHGGDGFGLGGGGSHSAITVNPIVRIQAQLNTIQPQPVLVVRTPSSDPGYLRLTALDRFDGQTFAPSTLQAPPQAVVSNGITAPVVDGDREAAQISVQNLAVHWLPVPAQVVSVQVDGDWRYDARAGTVFSARTDTRGLTYSSVSIRPNPSAAALEQAAPVTRADDPAIATALQLPDVPAAVRELTARVTRTATTPFDKAVAIQTFLTGPAFTYDLNVSSSDSTNALADFLLHTRRGFCQQFAAAMAVMARIEHIPSRIAVGFTRGEQQPDGSWLVSTHDAHAWPELYFSGFGWLPFEPTPRADGQTVTPDYTVATPANAPGGRTGADDTNKGGKDSSKQARGLTKNQRLDALLPEQLPADKRVAPVQHDGRLLALWVVLGVLAVLLLTPSVVRGWSRRRRWRRADSAVAEAAAAWAELRASAIDARLDWIDGLSPRASARVLRAEAGGLARAEVQALDRLVVAVQRAWYAPPAQRVTGGGLTDLRDDVELIRSGLLAEATLPERVLLRLWPRSTIQDARAAWGRVGELLDAIDVAGARLRARLRPRTAG
ncbi:MAG TPA: DUF3488 and transglutaminase-like domain-containing protein [Mycobacteriales bacterium]|nr:DUF3488 and transglutaminase-like domain-containing protein [Mycobacteriales bacterium]